MTELPDNILHLPQYQVLGCKSTDDEMHFQVDVPDPIACEECGVQGEFVRFGKRDVPYRDLPIHGKRVTLWVVRRRYTCRACKTTFRPQLPEMVDGFRMTLRLHEYVEKESFARSRSLPLWQNFDKTRFAFNNLLNISCRVRSTIERRFTNTRYTVSCHG